MRRRKDARGELRGGAAFWSRSERSAAAAATSTIASGELRLRFSEPSLPRDRLIHPESERDRATSRTNRREREQGNEKQRRDRRGKRTLKRKSCEQEERAIDVDRKKNELELSARSAPLDSALTLRCGALPLTLALAFFRGAEKPRSLPGFSLLSLLTCVALGVLSSCCRAEVKNKH